MSFAPLSDRVPLVTGANDPAGLGYGIAQGLAVDRTVIYFGFSLVPGFLASELTTCTR